jgi:hypothetical protein
VLLEPKKGTQGREMNRRSWIASTVALVGALSVSLPAAALGVSRLVGVDVGGGVAGQALLGA